MANIREAITLGRNGMMPAHLPIIGETRTRLAAAYVWSLSHGENAAAAPVTGLRFWARGVSLRG